MNQIKRESICTQLLNTGKHSYDAVCEMTDRELVYYWKRDCKPVVDKAVKSNTHS